MINHRSFQALSFPWRFNESTPFLLAPLSKSVDELLKSSQEGFVGAYKSILEAFVNSDTEFLESVMEPNLFSETKISLDTIKRRRHCLELVNPDSKVNTFMYNDFITAGVHVDRSKNKEKGFEVGSFDELTNKLKRDALGFTYNYLNGIVPTEQSHILLSVDLLFNSPSKLVLRDEEGNVLRGNESRSSEIHKLKFETMMEFKKGAFGSVGSLVSLLKCAYFNKNSLLEGPQWLVTDIDDFLQGNPHAKT